MAKSVKKTSIWDGLEPDENDVHTHTHDDVDTHTHTHMNDEPKAKTIKNKRIQILTYSNLVRRMDTYAKRNGLSRAEVFEMAVSEFLDNH